MGYKLNIQSKLEVTLSQKVPIYYSKCAILKYLCQSYTRLLLPKEPKLMVGIDLLVRKREQFVVIDQQQPNRSNTTILTETPLNDNQVDALVQAC